MSTYYIPDDEMALMSEGAAYGNYYQTTISQTNPNILYSPPLQQTVQHLPMEQPQPRQYYQQSHQAFPNLNSAYSSQPAWAPQPSPMIPTPMVYSPYPQPVGTLAPTTSYHAARSFSYPSPSEMAQIRPSRSHSATLAGAYTVDDDTETLYFRSLSPNAPDLREYGYPNKNGTWTCAYPGCTSKAVFTRGCDLRKHHKRHTKSFFCHHDGCPQSTGGGFSSKKDLARHEAKHNPGVMCEWNGCDRVFSRVDNMVSTPLTSPTTNLLTFTARPRQANTHKRLTVTTESRIRSLR
jgi:hypothetical protein